ncbi:polysaccharide pyruvyl transferase family protein [uncultured Nonlabens sp.]|uniref:polysaccharide pyruvyl transferase family protein n=1 Tax=uncultured Nonlabens sp. TaxID=859306 RepID=UPI0026258E78|nr:polysaccharide pyruvyl transferase family protein [uncultured Nonlabens sp.]
MNSYFKKIKKLIQFTFGSRPLVFWWSIKYRNGLPKENFGDILTPYLVNKISKQEVLFFELKSQFATIFKHYLMVGSIITFATKKSVIWGSGIISKSQPIKEATFLAVRGPRTQKRLRELGYPVPNIVGDPALLLPLIYKPKKEVKYELGIIPHYVDEQLAIELRGNASNTTIISLLTDEIEPVINKLLECKAVISTSLHGLIIAHAYGIPARWIQLSENLSGDGTKFYDYLESLDMVSEKIDCRGFTLESLSPNIDFHLPCPSNVRNLQEGLLSVYPLQIKDDRLLSIINR